MAILTTLFSALGRKIGDLLQAVFGWSIAALFGKLSSQKQVLVSVALVLALLWPIFLVGTVVPAAATFFIAFIPVKDLVTENVMRAVWIALAILAPVIVGLLIRVVSPDARRHSAFSSMINGYPLTLGFAISFLITLVTVPVVKISTLLKRWSEEHIYVQPKKDRYREALRNLCDACVMVGLSPIAAPVPKSMALSTKVIKFFSRGAVDSLLIDMPLMVRAKDVELYLYPADLLVRGSKRVVAHVRAAMNRTQLEQVAYLVNSEAAQNLQDELGRLFDALERHASSDEVSPALRSRLKEIVADSTKVDITFDEWVLLDRMARKVEDKLGRTHSLVEESGMKKTYGQVRELTDGPTLDNEARVAAQPRSPLEAMSTVQIVESALREARELVKIEMALAKGELKGELRAVQGAAVGFLIAGACVTSLLSLFGVALVLALGGTAPMAVAVAGGFGVLGGIATAAGYTMVPKKPLAKTRKHLSDDLKQLREHVA